MNVRDTLRAPRSPVGKHIYIYIYRERERDKTRLEVEVRDLLRAPRSFVVVA